MLNIESNYSLILLELVYDIEGAIPSKSRC